MTQETIGRVMRDLREEADAPGPSSSEMIAYFADRLEAAIKTAPERINLGFEEDEEALRAELGLDEGDEG